jgi:hypothetical protein
MGERGGMMAIHSLIIGIIMYSIFIYMKTEPIKAENRSVASVGATLLYMVLFGHGLPTKLNFNL